jgi:hypothetical protein
MPIQQSCTHISIGDDYDDDNHNNNNRSWQPIQAGTSQYNHKVNCTPVKVPVNELFQA